MSEDPIVKQFEGTVDVNSDVTPITRQPITQVTPNTWTEMSLNELWDQHNTLSQRLMYASEAGSPDMIQQLQRGIFTLEQIIKAKSPDLGLL